MAARDNQACWCHLKVDRSSFMVLTHTHISPMLQVGPAFPPYRASMRQRMQDYAFMVALQHTHGRQSVRAVHDEDGAVGCQTASLALLPLASGKASFKGNCCPTCLSAGEKTWKLWRPELCGLTGRSPHSLCARDPPCCQPHCGSNCFAGGPFPFLAFGLEGNLSLVDIYVVQRS